LAMWFQATTGDFCFQLVNFWKIFSLEIALPKEPNLDRKPQWKVLYKDCSFHPDRFLLSFGSFGHAISEIFFRNRPIRNNNCL
jgi:hypothetical protein